MIDETRLDDPLALERLDSRGFLRALATSGAQVRRSMLSATEAGIERLSPQERPRSVVVASLGGSAIVCDVLDLLAEAGSPIPLTIRRGAPLPGWVGPLDLVIAVSQSGRAAGPVQLAAEAARRGAGLVTVGAADSPLAYASASGRGIHVPVDSEVPTSRTGLWSLLTPVLMAADRLGLVDVADEALLATADRLDQRAEECRPSSESFLNPAKGLAMALDARMPMVLGDGPLAGVAARRAASMLARTARIPAIDGELPDAAAQIVACFDGPFGADLGAEVRGESAGGGARDIFADPYLDGPPTPSLALLLLRCSRDGDAPLASNMAAAAEQAGVRVHQVEAEGESPLEEWASLSALTDFAATYLALGLGLDPSLSPHLAGLRDHGR